LIERCRSNRSSIAVLAGALAVCAAVGWGVSGYASRIRNGVFDRGDPLLTAWILAWGPRQLVHDPVHLFEGNIYHPFHDTLAYTENILGPALLAAPARLFTSNPVAVQNVSILTAFLALGLAAYLYFRWISASVLAAAFGAVFVTLSPVRFGQLGHIQMLHTAGLPLLLFSLHSHFERPRVSSGLLVAVAVLFELLSSFYLGVMAGLVLLVFLILALPAFGRRQWTAACLRLLPWGAASLLIVIPMTLPYWRLARDFGFVRSIEGMEDNWASHKDYLRPLFGSFAARIAREYGTRAGRSLYLGCTAILLGLVGLRSLRPAGPEKPNRQRFAAQLFVALAVVFFALSLGGWRTVGHHRVLLPFYWLHEVPGFAGIRVPVRFGVVVDLAVAGLAVLGLARIQRWLGPRLFYAAPVPILLIGAAAILERVPPFRVVPLEHVEVGEQVPKVYRWLATDTAGDRVLELPMATERREREAWDVAQYRQVYYTTYHWKKTVNGLGGYLPPGYADLQDRMGKFPAPECFRLLSLLPIDRVVVHRKLYSMPIPRSLFEAVGFRVLYDTEEALVAEVHQEGAAMERRFDPKLEVIAEPSPGRALSLRVHWNPDLAEYLYPPARVEFRVRSTDASGRERRTEERTWLLVPVPQDFQASVEPGIRTLTVTVTPDQKQSVERNWTFAAPRSPQ
jgi:hypothetical protein